MGRGGRGAVMGKGVGGWDRVLGLGGRGLGGWAGGRGGGGECAMMMGWGEVCR